MMRKVVVLRKLYTTLRKFSILTLGPSVIILIFALSTVVLCSENSQGGNSPTVAERPSAVQSSPTQGADSAQAAQGPVQATPSPQSSAKNDDQNTFRPRLPMYYAKVVDEKQRQKIYDIQRKYHPQIADLQKQLEKLIAQRDAEIEAVLTPQQKAEIEKLRQESAQRRKENAKAGQPAESNPQPQQ